MAKLTRFTLPVFAGSATQTQTSVFGTMKTSPEYTTDVAAAINTQAYSDGWFEAIELGYAPFVEDMNSLQRAITYQISYGQQQGIPEWASDTEYYVGSFAKLNTATGAQVYCSLVDNNVGNLVSDTTKWKLVLDTANTCVTVNTPQTISAEKTFANTLREKTTGTSAGSYVDFIQEINNARRGTLRTKYNDNGSYSVMLGNNGLDASTPAGITVTRDATKTWAEAPSTPDVGDNSRKIATTAFVTGAINTINNAVVHKTGDETVSGSKTFTNNITVQVQYPYINNKCSDATKGTALSQYRHSGFMFTDKDLKELAGLVNVYNTDKSTYSEIRAYAANSASDTAYSAVSIHRNNDGTGYATAPNSDRNGSIVTTVAKSKSANGYFKLGNGLIIQWGTLSSGKTITYSTAFTNANSYALVFNNNSTTDGYGRGNKIESKSSTSATVYSLCENPIRWLAIGY